jgi:hypothetical protein
MATGRVSSRKGAKMACSNSSETIACRSQGVPQLVK